MTDPAAHVSDEAYALGYRDGHAEGLRGITAAQHRAEAAETRLAAARALADEWGWMKSDDETPSRLEMYLALRSALGVGCATCSGRGVWMDEPCGDCAPFYCYPCARGDHDEHKLAWMPDVPCECPPCARCTIPYPHGPHLIDDGRLQVQCPGMEQP